jgi:hypothetical protein
MNYEVIESKVWKHKVTGQLVSIYGACPWTVDSDRPNWEMVTRGWTVENPYTGEIGIGRPPWQTREEAQQFADTHKPNQTLMYD